MIKNSEFFQGEVLDDAKVPVMRILPASNGQALVKLDCSFIDRVCQAGAWERVAIQIV